MGILQPPMGISAWIRLNPWHAKPMRHLTISKSPRQAAGVRTPLVSRLQRLNAKIPTNTRKKKQKKRRKRKSILRRKEEVERTHEPMLAVNVNELQSTADADVNGRQSTDAKVCMAVYGA